MNNFERAKFLIVAAQESLAEAEFSFERKVWNLVIRRCQEAVELGLSALLAFIGVDYPKDHDKAPLAIKVFRENSIPIRSISSKELERISFDLSRKRGPALHQEEGYDKQTAKSAIKNAKKVIRFIHSSQRIITQKYGSTK